MGAGANVGARVSAAGSSVRRMKPFGLRGVQSDGRAESYHSTCK